MLDFAARMARNHHEATQGDLQRLRDHGFRDADILDMIYWIAAFNMSNTLTDLMGLDLHENSPVVFVEDDGAAVELHHHVVDNPRHETVRAGWEQAVVKTLDGGSHEWINSPQLTWDDVTGKVILVTYWDVTHTNSLLGIPYLGRWHRLYASQDLLILGVHTAEFPIAKEASIARSEIERLGIEFPVVLDPTYRKSPGANNRFWPAIHLIDREGYVRYRHYGPGDYELIEHKLQTLLQEQQPVEAGDAGLPQDIVPGENQWLDPEATPDLYGFRAVDPRFGIRTAPEGAQRYEVPESIERHRLYMSGTWRIDSDGLRLSKGTGKLTFQYCARSVGLFASPGGSGRARFRVQLDGGPVPEKVAGADLSKDSRVIVDRPRHHALVDHGGLEVHRMEVEVDDVGAGVHVFQFLPFRGEG